MSVETKRISINGKEYTVKHWTLKQRTEITDLKTGSELYSIFYGIDGFKSIEEVNNLDHVLAAKLYLEVLDFNSMDADFLQRSQNLQERAKALQNLLPPKAP